MNLQLPEHVRRLAAGEKFHFACHQGVECFTDCCRELELALTPYDVLRLKNALHMDSAEFLDRYAVMEKEESDVFPRFYLAMVDDGRASCPFVTRNGCKIYDHRPGACRTYPLGRAVSQTACGHIREFYVLLTEPHCRGFGGPAGFTVEEWVMDQGLSLYNRLNDEVMAILQHDRVRKGLRFSPEQLERFVLALYNLDAFRAAVLVENFFSFALNPVEQQAIAADDTALLRFGIRWLQRELFDEQDAGTAKGDPTADPLGQERTDHLRRIAEQFRDGEGGCHGPDHTMRVHRTALHIGRLMGARLDVLSAAALLHDIGRPYEKKEKGRICHAEKGAELAREILQDLDFSPVQIKEIVHCIETHRYRGDKAPKSLEARILFDADKLDSIGAIGIGRAFLFAGQVGAKLHNSDSDIVGSLSYSTEDTAYREFKVKLSKVKDRLLTPEGRRLAEERHAFMESFFQRLEREINGTAAEERTGHG